MREQQFIRFVQEICFLLKLSQPCSKTALQYFLQFKEYQNHSYDQEILVAACIYLSVKIFEEEVRIRDILNMIYVLTSLYKISAQQANQEREEKQEKQEKQAEKKQDHQEIKEQKGSNQQKQAQPANTNQIIILDKQPSQNSQSQQQQPYILLKNIQHLQNLHSLIQPKYSLSDYNQYKGKIIQAEQMLLRILGFSFSLSEQNKKQLKRLLITIHHLRMPSTMAETIIKVYNDMHYIDIAYWPEGVVYFGFLVTKVFVQEKQAKNQEKVENNVPTIDLELKESISEASYKKVNDKELAQIKRIKDFITLMSPKKWQELLCTDMKKLQNYAEKLANFYSNIHITH